MRILILLIILSISSCKISNNKVELTYFDNTKDTIVIRGSNLSLHAGCYSYRDQKGTPISICGVKKLKIIE